jgi:DNA-binding winged helix-turn-helix (wHTH) protein
VLSPARRVLAGRGAVVPLIPRYFDLLVLLVEQRDRAVAKDEIFERVWTDVVVSESALTQGIRVIRRALGDDPREPRFVRTVSRRGYQFVFAPVELEDDSGPWPVELEARASDDADRPADATAVEAGRIVPLPAIVLRGAALAALGTAAAGVLGGLAGGLALRLVPGSDTGAQVALTLALVGALAGALGGGGVGAGLAAAGALARSSRTLALAAGGALAGLSTGWLAHHAARAVLTGLFGRDVPGMGGPIEGLVLGAAAGLGYAIATRHAPEEIATAAPSRARGRAVALTGLAAGIAGVILALAGRHLVGSSLDLMAGAFAGSQVGLEPLARLLGEEHLRPVTRMAVSAFEGALFGGGLAFGLTARPRRP